MPAIVPLIIIWVCLAAFVLCLIGGLLILFERWTPHHAATRRWLVGTLLISVVGAVSGYATRQFSGNAVAAPVQPAEQRRVADTAGPHPAPPANPNPSASVEPNVPHSETSTDPAVPAAITAWADSTLGQRPQMAVALNAPYPACVGRLAAQPVEDVLEADASACYRELERFHTEQVLPVYARKAPYETNLERQEETLRPGHLESSTLPRYAYVLAEMERLRGDAWDEFVALDRRIADDKSNCWRRKCRARS